MKRLFTALALLFAVLLFPGRSEATTTCTAGTTALSFGNIDPSDGEVDVSATLTYTCTTSGISLLNGGAKIRLCFSIGAGAQGTGSLDPRRMISGANEMSFNVYKDGARAIIWGTRSDAFGSQDVQIDNLALVGIPGLLPPVTNGGTFTIYGRVPAGQTLASGSYSNSFSGIHAEMAYRYNEQLTSLLPPFNPPASCTTGGTGGSTDTFPFLASAGVQIACTVAAAPLAFGTVTSLGGQSATSNLSVTCTQGGVYTISLDGGSSGNPMSRQMTRGPDVIQYQLYKDAGHAEVWGNTTGTTAGGTGTGSAASIPVYGVVSAQGAKPSGVYTDTITVTVSF